MDPRIALADWLGGIGNSRDNAMNYNEWISRGGFPARIALEPNTKEFNNGDGIATVVDIEFSTVKAVLNRSGKVVRVKRNGIARVLV